MVEVLVGGSGAADADDVTGTSAACIQCQHFAFDPALEVHRADGDVTLNRQVQLGVTCWSSPHCPAGGSYIVGRYSSSQSSPVVFISEYSFSEYTLLSLASSALHDDRDVSSTAFRKLPEHCRWPNYKQCYYWSHLYEPYLGRSRG